MLVFMQYTKSFTKTPSLRVNDATPRWAFSPWSGASSSSEADESLASETGERLKQSAIKPRQPPVLPTPILDPRC